MFSGNLEKSFWCLRSQLRTDFTHCFISYIIDFERGNHGSVNCSNLTYKKKLDFIFEI